MVHLLISAHCFVDKPTRKVKNFEYVFNNSKIVVTIENKSFKFRVRR